MTNFLLSIPSIILSNLLSLQLFSILPSKVSKGDCTRLLDELERLERMSDIPLKLMDANPVEKLLKSQKLRRVIRQLCLQSWANMNSVKLSPSIKVLEMSDCPHLEGVLVDVENDGGQGFLLHDTVPSKFRHQ